MCRSVDPAGKFLVKHANQIMWCSQKHCLVIGEKNSCLGCELSRNTPLYHPSNSCQWEENRKSKLIQENLSNRSKIYTLILVHLAFSILKHSLTWDKFLLSLIWEYSNVQEYFRNTGVLEIACCNVESSYVESLSFGNVHGQDFAQGCRYVWDIGTIGL